MAAPGLGGATMAAPVVGDDTIAVLEEEQHLRVPIIGRQRPPMAEHDGLTLAPVLVEDLDAVFGRDGRHGLVSSVESRWLRVAHGSRITSSASRWGGPHRLRCLASTGRGLCRKYRLPSLIVST